jgi:hypothetical protein
MKAIGCGNGAAPQIGPRPDRMETKEGKEQAMRTSDSSKRWRKAVIAIAAVAGLGAAAQVLAHPGMGFGPGMAGPGFGPGAGGPGFGPGAMAGKGPGMMMRGGFAGPAVGQQLMTPDEQRAFIEKMQNAKTPDERQKLAEANRAEMEKRAKEKGISLPQPHGPRAGFGPNLAPPFAAPTR